MTRQELIEELIDLKEVTNPDRKASTLWNIVHTEDGMEFAEEYMEFAGVSHVADEIMKRVDGVVTDLTPLGILIQGITRWEATWFYINGYGNFEDLTDDKLDRMIDDIINNLPEDMEDEEDE